MESIRMQHTGNYINYVNIKFIPSMKINNQQTLIAILYIRHSYIDTYISHTFLSIVYCMIYIISIRVNVSRKLKSPNYPWYGQFSVLTSLITWFFLIIIHTSETSFSNISLALWHSGIEQYANTHTHTHATLNVQCTLALPHNL